MYCKGLRLHAEHTHTHQIPSGYGRKHLRSYPTTNEWCHERYPEAASNLGRKKGGPNDTIPTSTSPLNVRYAATTPTNLHGEKDTTVRHKAMLDGNTRAWSNDDASNSNCDSNTCLRRLWILVFTTAESGSVSADVAYNVTICRTSCDPLQITFGWH